MIEKEYDISGAIVFWSLQPTPYQAIREVFERMGYADCVPNPRTDQSALENSIRTVYGTKNKTIVSRKQPKRNGVELVNIERSTQRNGYVTNFGARVLGSRVKADYGFADECALTEEFLKLKARLTTTAVGQALVAVLEKMDGMTGLKPGVYYIPEHHLKRWKELAELVEGCQEGNKITTARVAMAMPTGRANRQTLVEALRMGSRGRGRMACRRQSSPAWRNTTRTSWRPRSPRPSNSIKSSGAGAACRAGWPEPSPSCSTPRLTRPGNCWRR
jgi:hypothetical protein